jgi:hypothetical protein
MHKAEYYRAQAKFCVEIAGEIKRSDYRDWWLSMAQEWRELADHPGRNLREPQVSDHPQLRRSH